MRRREPLLGCIHMRVRLRRGTRIDAFQPLDPRPRLNTESKCAPQRIELPRAILEEIMGKALAQVGLGEWFCLPLMQSAVTGLPLD